MTDLYFFISRHDIFPVFVFFEEKNNYTNMIKTDMEDANVCFDKSRISLKNIVF